MRIFPETKSELRSVLHALVHAYQNGTAWGPVAVESRKRGRGLTEVIMVESKLDELLFEMDILTLPSPTLDERSYKFQIDEVALQKELEDELGYTLTRAAETDMACVRFIRALRKGKQVSRVEDAGFVFLTTNSALSRAAFNFEREEFEGWIFSTVVTDFHLSHLVWLKLPVKSSELAKTELLASCYAAMHPPQSFWKDYLREVDRLKSQGFVTPRDHELLRHSLKAPDTLMEVTRGEVDGLTEGNIRQILERLQKEYTAEKDVEIEAILKQKEDIEVEVKRSTQLSEEVQTKLSDASETEKKLRAEIGEQIAEIDRLRRLDAEKENILARRREKAAKLASTIGKIFYVVAWLIFGILTVASFFSHWSVWLAVPAGIVGLFNIAAGFSGHTVRTNAEKLAIYTLRKLLD